MKFKLVLLNVLFLADALTAQEFAIPPITIGRGAKHAQTSSTPAKLGNGFSSIANQLRINSGFESITTARTTFNRVEYNSFIATSLHELEEGLNKSGGLSVYGVGASANSSSTSSFNSYSVHIVVSCRVHSYTDSVSDPKLSQEAKTLLQSAFFGLRSFDPDKLSEFHRKYGDTFVENIEYGGLFTAVISVECESQSDQKSTAKGLNAAFKGFKVSGNRDSSWSSITQSKTVTAKILFSGGGLEGLSLPNENDPTAVLDFARSIPSKIANRDGVIAYSVMPYSPLLSRNQADINIRLRDTYKLAEESKKSLYLISGKLDDYLYALDHPEDFGVLPSSPDIKLPNGFKSLDLNGVGQAIQFLKNDKNALVEYLHNLETSPFASRSSPPLSSTQQRLPWGQTYLRRVWYDFHITKKNTKNRFVSFGNGDADVTTRSGRTTKVDLHMRSLYDPSTKKISVKSKCTITESAHDHTKFVGNFSSIGIPRTSILQTYTFKGFDTSSGVIFDKRFIVHGQKHSEINFESISPGLPNHLGFRACIDSPSGNDKNAIYMLASGTFAVWYTVNN